MSRAHAGVWAATSASEAETEALGVCLGRALAPGDRVALEGGLGAGKTRLVAGIARGIEARARVRSPTFTLLNEYRGRVMLRHVDLYRLEGAAVERFAFELEEGLEDAVLVIEWAEKLAPAWLEDALWVRIEVAGPEHRVFHVSAGGSRSSALLEAWRAAAQAAHES